SRTIAIWRHLLNVRHHRTDGWPFVSVKCTYGYRLLDYLISHDYRMLNDYAF
ncbi:hypothetical protein WG66_015278, partial [Moniliophthora roreri]